MNFIPNARIEVKTHQRLRELAAFSRGTLEFPIDVERIAEQIFGLKLLWDAIEEEPGETILAGLEAHKRVMVFNESHCNLFESKPGLYRMTLGHELGHWDLYPVGGGSQRTLGMSAESRVYRSSGIGSLSVPIAFLNSDAGRDFLIRVRSRTDSPRESAVVNRYASALLMPEEEVRARVRLIDRTQWPQLYRLAEHFGVTISALVVRLEQMNLIFVGEDKRIYENPQQAAGQRTLFG